jgi:hypothetical protein
MRVHSLSHRMQACLLAVVCTMPCGCVSVAGLQDLHFSCANKHRANEAWKCNFSRDQRKACSEDFEHGFKQGYYDTAMGKDCRLPPVAPPQYWSARYQSCSGQCAVQDWFKGYQHGITAAQAGACPSFSEVPVSPGAPVLNKTGCGVCYSPDHCNCREPADALDNCLDHATPTYTEHELVPQATNQLNKADVQKSKAHLHEAMMDLPNSRAVSPASFNSGLIGGYGSRDAG